MTGQRLVPGLASPSLGTPRRKAARDRFLTVLDSIHDATLDPQAVYSFKVMVLAEHEHSHM